MAKPNLTVTVEPVQGRGAEATYLRIGAATSNSQAQVEIVLVLQIRNNESNPIKIIGVTFSFPDSQYPDVNMKGIDFYDMDIPANGVTYWSNGRVELNSGEWWDNMVFLDSPGPTKVTVSLECQNITSGTNFSEPYTVTKNLKYHRSPTNTDSYKFPFDISDLRANEYYYTRAWHKTNGQGIGSEIFTLDISAMGYDDKTRTWSAFLPDTDHSQKESHRMWNKPIRAMAAGYAISWVDTNEDNATNPGNNIWIKYGPTDITGYVEYVYHAHLKQNSIPTDDIKSKPPPVRVEQGQIIGYTGNSGQSNNSPHTHVQCLSNSNRGSFPRPFPFHDAWIVDYSKLTSTNTDGMWVNLHGQGVSKEYVAIWPSHEKPYINPLSGPPLNEHTWKTVLTGHRLIYLRSNRILDWVPASGHYRIWDYDENATGNSNALKWPPVTQGNWATITSGHELVFIHALDKMLDWEPATGHYRLWNYDHNATGSTDPLSGPIDQASSSNGLLGPGRVVIPITDKLLIWEISSGHWDLLKYKTHPPFPNLELFSGDHIEGTWKTVHTGHTLIYLGLDPFENDKPRMLDWEKQTGYYRIWRLDDRVISTNKKPLQYPPVVEGAWQNIRTGHTLVYLGSNRVLDWEPASGHYRIWNYDRR